MEVRRLLSCCGGIGLTGDVASSSSSVWWLLLLPWLPRPNEPSSLQASTRIRGIDVTQSDLERSRRGGGQKEGTRPVPPSSVEPAAAATAAPDRRSVRNKNEDSFILLIKETITQWCTHSTHAKWTRDATGSVGTLGATADRWALKRSFSLSPLLFLLPSSHQRQPPPFQFVFTLSFLPSSSSFLCSIQQLRIGREPNSLMSITGPNPLSRSQRCELKRLGLSFSSSSSALFLLLFRRRRRV